MSGDQVWSGEADIVFHQFFWCYPWSSATGIGEVANEQDLERFIEQLPMVQGGVLNVEVLRLQPYVGLESLFSVDRV